jgi:ketosteroid isomerase-like protein
MNIKIPAIIAEFLKAKNSYDSTAFVACFTDDAVVQDEGREMHGTAAIKKWIENSHAKYQDTVTAKGLVVCNNETVLTAQVSGNFTGSPVLLDFHFTIKDGKIIMLSINLTGD